MEESQMMIDTVTQLLEEAQATGVFTYPGSIEDNVFVFLHALAWFFPTTVDAYREELKEAYLRRILHWFVQLWFGEPNVSGGHPI